jgi:hypothetical protein
VPGDLRLMPFRGSIAVEAGRVSWSALRRGRWRRLFPDVYVAADVEMDHRWWCYSALMYAGRAPGVAVSGLSAAALMGVDLLPVDGGPVELTVPPTLRRESRRPSLVVIRSLLDASDLCMVGGLPVTSPERTAFDLARRSSATEAIVALDALLHRRLVGVQRLDSYALEVAGRPGSVRFARALAMAEPLSESPMESRTRMCLVGAGLPRPVAQHEVFDEAGAFVARLDLAYRRERVGIEYEGDHHRDRAVFRRDVARGNALASLDWAIVRVTAPDIYRTPAQFASRVERLLRARRPRPS